MRIEHIRVCTQPYLQHRFQARRGAAPSNITLPSTVKKRELRIVSYHEFFEGREERPRTKQRRRRRKGGRRRCASDNTAIKG